MLVIKTLDSGEFYAVIFEVYGTAEERESASMFFQTLFAAFDDGADTDLRSDQHPVDELDTTALTPSGSTRWLVRGERYIRLAEKHFAQCLAVNTLD